MGELQAGELDLPGLVTGQRELIEVPVIERPIVLELQGAHRMRHPLQRIALAVCPVVGRVDAPVVTGAVMVPAPDPIHHRIAELHVLRVHVDLRAQHPGAVVELAGAHPAQQVEVLLDRAIPIRAGDARFPVAAALLGDGVGVLVVDVRLALAYQFLRPLVDLLEVVRGMPDRGRGETEPGEVFQDRLAVCRFLGVGVGVVEAEVADPAEVLGDTEVHRDRLGVADVQEPVRLGREPGLHAPGIGALLVVGANESVDEVVGRPGLRHGRQRSTHGMVPSPAGRPSAGGGVSPCGRRC